MSASEMVLLGLLVIAVGVVIYLLAARGQPTTTALPQPTVDPRIEAALASLPTIQQDLGSLRTTIQALPSHGVVQGIENRLSNLENRVPNTLAANLTTLDAKLTTIVADTKLTAIHEATQELLSKLAGGKGRGAAGEFLVGEALKLLPATMLERDFKVGGKTVEFALILPNNKRLPIDSKWAAADLLERLDKEASLDGQQPLINEIERVVLAKAAEVAKYRNPAVTTDIGLAAIPDAAYRVCRKAHALSYTEYGVLVLPYSMVAPYVLALYNIHLKYGQAIELSNLQEYLNVIELEVKNIDGDLEGRIKEASTRANNAYDSIKNALARIRAAAEFLKSAPARVPVASVEGAQGETAQAAGERSGES